MRCSSLRWPITGSTAARRRKARLMTGVSAALLAGDIDLEAVVLGRIVAAVAGIGDDRGRGRLRSVVSMSGITVASVCPSYGLPGSALTCATNWPPRQRWSGRGDADLDAELVGLVRLALADAFDLGRVQRIDLAARARAGVGPGPAGPARAAGRSRLGEVGRPAILRVMSRITRPSMVRRLRQSAGWPAGTAWHGHSAGAGSARACRPGHRTGAARRRCSWRAAPAALGRGASAWRRSGRRSAFSCTVVSTITCGEVGGLGGPGAGRDGRLSCSSAISRSSPMRWRQRVSEERSNGRRCRKNSSPQKS